MTIDDLINTEAFLSIQESVYGNDGWINYPERRGRIETAAEDGGEGSFHAEIIQDWRDALALLSVIDPDYPEDGGDLTEEEHATLEKKIDDCEAWHEANGSLWEQVG
jgi:hypothetical protein